MRPELNRVGNTSLYLSNFVADQKQKNPFELSTFKVRKSQGNEETK